MELSGEVGLVVGVVGALAGLLGGGWAFLTKRAELKASPPAQMIEAEAKAVVAHGDVAQKFAEAAVAMLQPVTEELNTMRRRFDEQAARHARELAQVRDDLSRCHEGHEACEAKYAELERRFLLAKVEEPPPAYLPGLDPHAARQRRR